MKFSVERDSLLSALQKVQSVVEKKNTVQILSNILFSVTDQRLSLCATDLEVGMKVTIPVQNAEAGTLTLSAKHFLDIVKELPSGEIQIKRKSNDWVEILAGRSRFNVVSLSAEEYPALPDFASKEYYDARVPALLEMIHCTAFAVSTDATRYHLNGVYFENISDSLMRMTATDGHRLSFVDQEVFLKMPEFKRGIIIPRKGLMELKKLLDESTDVLGLAFDRGYFFAKSGDQYLFVRLIEGEYPDYKQVIPKNTDRRALFSREVLQSALRRVSLLAHEKSRGVKLHFDSGLLVVTSSNPDMGDAREEVEIDYQASGVDIGFNARYLLDYLEVSSSDKIEFHFSDRLSPGILQSTAEKNHCYVIMPMRI